MANSSRSANQPAKDVAGKLNDMASQVGSSIKDAATQAMEKSTEKADDIAANVGESIREFGQLLKSNSAEGLLGAASDAVAGTVTRGGQYLQDAKFRGATDDLSQLIQRNPIPAVLIALGIGWFIARRV